MNYAKIQKLCGDRKITIRDLEIKVGLSNGTINKWKTADANPRVEGVKAVADYFGTTVEDLLN